MIKGKYARKGRDPHGGRAGEPGRRSRAAAGRGTRSTSGCRAGVAGRFADHEVRLPIEAWAAIAAALQVAPGVFVNVPALPAGDHRCRQSVRRCLHVVPAKWAEPGVTVCALVTSVSRAGAGARAAKPRSRGLRLAPARYPCLVRRAHRRLRARHAGVVGWDEDTTGEASDLDDDDPERALGMTETRCLTVAEVAARYNTTAKHIRGLVQRKMIPHRKFGGVLRFDEAELEEWTKPPQSATSESLLALQHELYPPGSAESSRRTRVPMLSGWRWIRKT